MSAEPTSPSAPRVAVVTGGWRGIGRATAARLAADGFAVVIGYAGNRDLAEAAARGITAVGGRAVAVRADIADEGQVAELFRAAATEFGGVDVVVHAAGRMRLAPIAELDLAELDTMHRTDIRGTFVVAREAARTLRRGGAFVGFSSSVESLAFAPGPTATDLFLDGKDEETVARPAAQPPLERLGTPADLADVVAFLVSPAGHWVNGQVVRANGGIV
ncbi:SDR family oxidoreductase [Streptomyces yokosukanensis]|uniref:SDR family oxidoreductase n=1 Tax=Streptomyces yokosukanensis TaxID=67386 RepID=UPI003442CABF